MAKIRILLTGHGGSRNRGCEAILRSTVDIVRRHVGPVHITVLSYHPQSDQVALRGDADAIEIHDAEAQIPRRYSPQWFIDTFSRLVHISSPPFRLFPKGLISNRALYRGSNVVMHIGGDNFCYGEDKHWFDELAFARSNGARTVIWAASIGPFGEEVEDKWAKELRKVDLITVREELTLKYLQKLGVVENVRRVADPAFLLPVSSEGALRVNRKEGDIIVGIGMSDLVSAYGSGRRDYLESFRQLVKKLLSDAGIRVVLIPHMIGDLGYSNDLAVCVSLANRLNRPDRVTVLGRDHNACQTKYVISQCDYFIGARTHSTIASLSTGIPTLTIAYSPKAYGINRDIFGHTDYVVPISELSANVLLEKFGLLCRNRQKIVEELVKSRPLLREAADRGGEYLAELLHMTSK